MCLPSFPFKDCVFFSDRQLSLFNIYLGLFVCMCQDFLFFLFVFKYF